MIDKEKMKALDAHWNEAIKLMEEYGFITQAYSGVSVVMTHEKQLEMWGEEKYLQRQKEMFRSDMSVPES